MLVKSTFDKMIFRLSVFYIVLPILLFVSGWLKLPLAIFMALIILISMIRLIRNGLQPAPQNLYFKKRILIFLLILLTLWVALSGIGGFSFQNSDFNYRNAILRDLINRPWPVIYDYSHLALLKSNSSGILGGATDSPYAMLIYYIAFWLPAAAFGKIFGWYAANAFLFFWAFLGILLTVYYLFRILGQIKLRIVLIFIFFSGLDLVGYIQLYQRTPGLTEHIEWWSGLQYSANTTQLFWVFNQSIVIWLALLLILQLKNSKSLFFLYGLLLLHGPFPFLGLLPVVLWKAYQGYPLSEHWIKNQFFANLAVFGRWFWQGVLRAVSFENLAGGISVILVTYLYFANNRSGGSMGINQLNSNFFLFILLEVGVYLLLVAKNEKQSPLFWIAAGSFILIPLFRVGGSQDFCMRVSIPALFLLQLMVQKESLKILPPVSKEKAQSLSLYLKTEFWPVFKKVTLVIFLLLGAFTPFTEISRSLSYTWPTYPVTEQVLHQMGLSWQNSSSLILQSWGSILLEQSSSGRRWADEVVTLEKNRETSANFTGSIEDNFFYTYLARQSKEVGQNEA